MKVVTDNMMSLQVELNLLIEKRADLANQARKIKLKEDAIRKKIEQIKPTELTVSAHAVSRYKERIMDLPDKVIKKLLNDPELYQQYNSKGMGRYQSSKLPNVIAVINQFNVLTVYQANDVFLRLKVLGKYMTYYIDRIAKGEVAMSFDTYYGQFDLKNLKAPRTYNYIFLTR